MSINNTIDEIRIALNNTSLILTDIFNKGHDVPFEKLEQLILHETFYVPAENNKTLKIKSAVIYKNDNIIVIKTEFPPYCALGLHHHSNCIEDFHILSGSVFETTTRTQKLAGDFFSFPANKKHHYLSQSKKVIGIVTVKKTYAVLEA